MSDNNFHMLWSTVEPYGPIVCKRPDWKQCPEHAHLTEKRPSVNFKVDVLVDSDGSMEATVGSVSWDEYDSASDNVKVNVIPASTTATSSAYVNKIYNVNGQNVSSGTLKDLGHDDKRIDAIFNRPTAGDQLPPNKEQIEARLAFAIEEANFYNAAQSIADKKFRFPTYNNRDERIDFYRGEMTKAMNSYEKLHSRYKELQMLEQPSSNTSRVPLNYTADRFEEVRHLADASGLHMNLRRSFSDMEKDEKFRMKFIGKKPFEIWGKN
jgi:hypothetical protein